MATTPAARYTQAHEDEPDQALVRCVVQVTDEFAQVATNEGKGRRHLRPQHCSLPRRVEPTLEALFLLQELEVFLLRLARLDDAARDRVHQPLDGLVDLVQLGLQLLSELILGWSAVEQPGGVLEVLVQAQALLEQLDQEPLNDRSGGGLPERLPLAARPTRVLVAAADVLGDAGTAPRLLCSLARHRTAAPRAA